MPLITQSEYNGMPPTYRAIRDGVPYLLYLDESGVGVWGPVQIVPDPDPRYDTQKILASVRAELKHAQEVHDQSPDLTTFQDLKFWRKKVREYQDRAADREHPPSGAPSP